MPHRDVSGRGVGRVVEGVSIPYVGRSLSTIHDSRKHRYERERTGPLKTADQQRAESADAGETRSAGRPLAILFVTVFLDLVGFGIVIPLLPLYAEIFGATPVAVTWLVAVYSLMQLFFAPWWGQLSDRRGRRPVLLIGLFGSAISYLMFGLAGSLAGLFVARILAGVMGANIGVAQAYVADTTSPEDRARGMGIIGAAFGLGFILGPLIGGALSLHGLSVPFFAAAGLSFLNACLAIVWLPEVRKPSAKESVTIRQSGIGERLRTMSTLLRSRSFAPLYLAFFMITFAFAELEATLSIWADRKWLLTPTEVAYLFAYLGLVASVVQGLIVGPVTRRFGDRQVAFGGGCILALGLAGLPIAAHPVVLAISLGAIAAGQGTAIPAVSSMISRAAPSDRQGQLLGVSQSLSALGRVTGPVLGGLAFSAVGIGAPFFSGAVVIMMGLVGLSFLDLSAATAMTETGAG